MNSEILDWNDAEMNVITTEGQYTLAVNKDQFTFTKEPRLISLNHPIMPHYNQKKSLGCLLILILDLGILVVVALAIGNL